ncbi:MAG: hypothetical protein AB1700_00050 [Bacillota bacterium]
MLKTLNDFGLRAAVRLAVLKDRKGISTVEVLLILGVATIILGGTYFGLKTLAPAWWNNYIVPQFPTT